MTTIHKTIDVEAPARTVYNQWTQFEEFPRFLEGVEHVRQIDDKRLRWRAEILGKDVEWESEIVQQIPDQRITWRSLSGARNAGSIAFQPLGPEKTRVELSMQFEPEGAVEKTGGALGVVSARVQGDLQRFKEFIEERGRETGGWRGEIHGSDVRKEPRH